MKGLIGDTNQKSSKPYIWAFNFQQDNKKMITFLFFVMS